MDGTIVLILLIVVGGPFIAGIWLIHRALDARDKIDRLNDRLDRLETDVQRLKSISVEERLEKKAAVAPAPVPTPAPAPIPKAEPPPIRVPVAPVAPAPVASAPREPVLPPRLPVPPPVQIPPSKQAEEPLVPAFANIRSAIDLEQFMGVKLFAWLGGLALFLGAVFFVKYSIDKNWIPDWLRAAMGFLTGLGLLVGGLKLSRKNYPTLSQTLCATGVVILYAVTFACKAYYHFAFFGPIPTFVFMVLVTAVAFLLAVRLNAQVVAILGMLGGFLTPILLSTGEDNPLGLFGYIAILVAGLLLVSLHRRWFYLAALGAMGTAFMQLGWADKFFVAGQYFEGDKIFTAFAALLVFQVLYLAAHAWARRRQESNEWLAGSALVMAAVALAFSAWFLTFEPLAQRPVLMFSFIFLVDAGVAALAWMEHKTAAFQPLAGLAVFALLGFWTARWLNGSMLNTALVFYFVFAVAHAAFPILLQRRFGLKTPLWAGHVFPALALVLVLVPIFKITEISFIVWPFVLLVDLLAIALSVILGSLLSVVVVLLLTLVATAALILNIPAALTGLPVSFFLLGAFAVFFVVASVWLWRKLKPPMAEVGAELDSLKLSQQLPLLSAVLPFLLLIMASARLPLIDPSPVFGLGLLLTVLLLGVAKIMAVDALPAVGLICVASLEISWHLSHFQPAMAEVSLVWYFVHLTIFTLYPFVFRRQFEGKTVPWATSALAGLPQFFLVHRLVGAAWPNHYMGLVPLAFALPSLVGLVTVLRKIPATVPARLAQLAWFGGVALFFITLIFPIQFDREWITIGWALEGVALLWLFHRVPHPGLQWAGAGLLAIAFARLALNPAVLDYHPRSAMAIFNWYLYTYGLVTAGLFAAARLAAPPRHRIGQFNAPALFNSLGTVLGFLLLNIEIADFFSEQGSTLTFQFSGNFARDMTYSIAWAVFALGLLVAGIAKKIPASRYAALALLSVTLLKLFFHDLAQLNQLYRIGALVGVAIIAMLASFAYQRFFTGVAQPKANNESPL